MPIQGMIQSSGYEATFFWFGVGQGLVVVLLSLLLRAPRPGETPASTPVAAVDARLFADRGAALADILGSLRNVRAWSAPAA